LQPWVGLVQPGTDIPLTARESEPGEAALVRLQVLTPLSILVFLASALVAAFAITPSLGTISDDYLTILTPRKILVAAYVLVLVVLQIGYCVLLAAARKEATRVRFPSVIRQI
jgi:hypothetical protein